MPPLPSPAPDQCLVYHVRHAATANNLAEPPLIQGQGSDLPLSDEGHTQAEQVGRLLAAQPVDAVFSSPLQRAAQTAEHVAKFHKLSVQAVDGLRECDVGAWEGKSWVDIERDEPEAYRAFMTRPAEHGYRGGENITQLLARVVPAMEGLMKDNLGRGIVVVSHNVVNRSYLAHVLGVPVERARGITQFNCGVNLLRYRKGRVKVLAVNNLFHLEKWT